MSDTFYLYKCGCCERLFISSATEKNVMEITSTQAQMWLEAKAKLGFPLTSIQKDILKGKI
ncbi:hypothetical protein CY658_21720 [Variovorax sp. RO1]|uniref:hypothetical protein n=1 Tax=Variovorax sp. RO1 TaxID=2066034 RepID=UPI000C716B17|nr:hypothetical protein [Variovorax sp. RO1]PLC03437.1 hypothetical protein CY658_21720 [Variovorax sp. RO1]